MQDIPRPVGGPVLLDGSGGVKVVARCSVDNEIVDLNDPDGHVCIPVKDGPPRKTTAAIAAREYEESLPEKTAAAEAEGADRLRAALEDDPQVDAGG